MVLAGLELPTLSQEITVLHNVLDFDPRQAYAAADYPELAAKLGQKYYDPKTGWTYKLVKLNDSGGFGTGTGALSAGRKLMKWVSAALHTMQNTTAANSRISGITPKGLQNLSQGDLFLVIVDGEHIPVVVGTEASDAVTDGNYVIPSAADTGKVDDGGSGYTEGSEDLIAEETSTTADDEVLVRTVKELR